MTKNKQNFGLFRAKAEFWPPLHDFSHGWLERHFTFFRPMWHYCGVTIVSLRFHIKITGWIVIIQEPATRLLMPSRVGRTTQRKQRTPAFEGRSLTFNNSSLIARDNASAQSRKVARTKVRSIWECVFVWKMKVFCISWPTMRPPVIGHPECAYSEWMNG